MTAQESPITSNGFIRDLSVWLRPVLNQPIIRRTRRNHAFEHATIHVLAQHIPNLQIAGRSDGNGFILIGEAPTEKIEAAAKEALSRLNKGERQLALHPNCGTNLVTTAFLASVAAMVGFTGTGRFNKWERLPLVMLLMIGAIIFSQPIGMSLQEHITTDSDMADLEIMSVQQDVYHVPFNGAKVTLHRIKTQST